MGSGKRRIGEVGMTEWVGFEAETKDGERSKDKGRRVCFGDKIYSIPCRARCFTSVDLAETVEFNRFFQLDRVKIDSAARS